MTRHVRRRAAASILAGAIAATALAAAPAEGCYVALAGDVADPSDDVVACETPTWIADPDGTKVGNAAVTDQSAYPTFSDEEPTTSVSGGAGAGYLGTSLLQLNEPDVDATGFTITGEVTGLVDAVALTLHGVHTGFARLPFSPTGPVPPENPDPTAPVTRAPMTAYVSIEIDGQPVVPTQSLAIDFTTDAAPTANASERFRATITGLASDYGFLGLDTGPEAVHTVTVRITPRYINTDPVVAFLYGTSEVPSSVVFNPVATEEGVTVVDW